MDMVSVKFEFKPVLRSYFLTNFKAIEIAKTVTGESDNDTAIREIKKRLNASEQFFNSEPFPANESDAAAYKLCSRDNDVKRYCPKRWAAMQKWFTSIRATMGMLAPKLVPLFHHVGKKNTMPNCPIQVIANFNPSAGVQVFFEPEGTCRRPAYYALPLFLNNYGPKFTQWIMIAHETWPGHHTQLQGMFIPPVKYP